jgi:hypothetical protein
VCEIITAIKKMKLELLEEIHPMIIGCVKAQALHLKPSPETKKELNALHGDINEIKDTQKKILDKLDEVMPTIREINSIRNSWTLVGKAGSIVVKCVVGIGIIMTALYSIKAWLLGK